MMNNTVPQFTPYKSTTSKRIFRIRTNSITWKISEEEKDCINGYAKIVKHTNLWKHDDLPDLYVKLEDLERDIVKVPTYIIV